MPRRKVKLPPCGEPRHDKGTCTNQQKFRVVFDGGASVRRVCGAHVRYWRSRGDAAITEIDTEEAKET